MSTVVLNINRIAPKDSAHECTNAGRDKHIDHDQLILLGKVRVILMIQNVSNGLDLGIVQGSVASYAYKGHITRPLPRSGGISRRFQRKNGWRKRWDSNPRTAKTVAGFQDRCIQPLCHTSELRRYPNSLR